MVFGHDYKVTRQVTYHVQEYTCKNCKKELTTNSNGNLIELTPKFKEINDVLERIHHKRIVRINKLKKPISLKGRAEKNLLVFNH